MALTLYTVGHSTRSLEELVSLLEREGVKSLVDVRTFPGSRRYPHFGRDALAAALRDRGIAYSHAPALGGRRRPRPDSPNAAWRNEGFRGYADHMGTPEFRDALTAVLDRAARAPTAVMCSEAVPWRCHRSLIADAAVARGAEVRHIMDGGAKPHTLTPFARVVNGEVRYDAAEPESPSPFGADGDGAHAAGAPPRVHQPGR